jgi:hypothetical protein
MLLRRFSHSPVLHTDYTGNPPPYGETPVLDVIWDSNLQIVRKGGWSWDKLPDGYPPTTQVGAGVLQDCFLCCVAVYY